MCTRGHWRPSEDEKLKELVALYGPHNWNAIAEKLQGRSGTGAVRCYYVCMIIKTKNRILLSMYIYTCLSFFWVGFGELYISTKS
jgi:hypothetical protein